MRLLHINIYVFPLLSLNSKTWSHDDFYSSIHSLWRRQIVESQKELFNESFGNTLHITTTFLIPLLMHCQIHWKFSFIFNKKIVALI